MISGLKVTLRGRDFIVPPVTRGLLKKYRAQFKACTDGSMTPPEQFDFFGDIVYDALTQNYPELALEHFDELLDFAGAAQAFSALMCDAEGVQKAGEMMAALQSGSAIGTTTPPASAATPAGAGAPPSS